jgi:hypothetical protein
VHVLNVMDLLIRCNCEYVSHSGVNMFIIFSPCTFWHGMIYFHGVLEFTEMCSEEHFTYCVAFHLLAVCYYYQWSVSANCVVLLRSVYGG